MPETEEELFKDLYVAGAIDAKGEFKVEISKSKQFALNYRLLPKFVLHTDRLRLAQFLDDWFLDRAIFATVEERSKNSFQIEVSREDHLERFIDVISPHIFATADDARLLMNDIDPLLEDARQDKETFIQVVGLIEMMDSYNPQSKYDTEFFREEWDL
jgi:hypothetical protein